MSVCVCDRERERERMNEREKGGATEKVRTECVHHVALEFQLSEVIINISHIFSVLLFQFCTAFHGMTKAITTQNMHIFT